LERTETLSAALIDHPRVPLRLVDTGSLAFACLCDSLRERGFINSISVATRGDRYEVIDGNCRFTAAKKIGLTSVPCIVKEGLSDAEIMELQIQANSIRLETTPVEFAKHIRRLLDSYPDVPMRLLAVRLRKSPTWISDILQLLYLPEHLQDVVNRGDINLSNAFWLARLPPGIREKYVAEARTMKARDFRELCAPVLKAYKEAKQFGKLEAKWCQPFKPHPYLRALKEIRTEAESHKIGPLLLAANDCRTPLDGFYLALDWAMNLDKDALASRESAWLASQRNKELDPALTDL
jgi:ParB/RepB/Spo0J family partition protein